MTGRSSQLEGGAPAERTPPSDAARLERRSLRERSARRQAEQLLEEKADELWRTNQQLAEANQSLEDQVAKRTQELTAALAVAQAAQETLRHQAEHDALTGLANRRSFSARLGRMIPAAAQHGHRIAVLHIDLDRFKQINDTIGHAAGDFVLVHVAKQLKQLVDEAPVASGFAARIGATSSSSL